MTKEILLILASVPLYLLNSFCDKFASLGGNRKSHIRYNAIKFFFGAACLLPLFLLDNAPKFEIGVLVCGCSCGILYAMSKTAILQGYEKTSVAFMTLCHAAGMILPCILGHFLWHEPVSMIALLGMVLAVSSIVLLKDNGRAQQTFDLKGIWIGVLVFLGSGGVMVAQKCMGLYFSHQSNSAYNFYSLFIAFLWLLGGFRPAKNIPLKVSAKPAWLFALGSALSLCVISLVMTSLAGKVPSVILFPLFNGLGIILVSIGSVFLFGERLTPKRIVGLFLGVIGLCLVNF